MINKTAAICLLVFSAGIALARIYDCGIVVRGLNYTNTFAISNASTSSSVQVKQVRSLCDCVKPIRYDTRIAPGKTGEVVLVLESAKCMGESRTPDTSLLASPFLLASQRAEALTGCGPKPVRFFVHRSPAFRPEPFSGSFESECMVRLPLASLASWRFNSTSVFLLVQGHSPDAVPDHGHVEAINRQVAKVAKSAKARRIFQMQ
mgnify:CR=1 FL=1